METETKENNVKIFLKKFWWVFAIAAAVLIAVGGIVLIKESNHRKELEKQEQKAKEQKTDETKKSGNEGYVYKEPTMTESELAKANAALAAGISIDDSANDFAVVPVATKVGLDGKVDNPKAYPLNWNDVKKVTLGADQENMYVRYDFFGIIPDKMATVDGDDIKSIMCNIDLPKFTTKSGKTDQGMMQIGLMYTEAKSGKDNKDESVGYVEVKPPRLGVSGVASPTQSNDKYGETIYGKNMNNGKVKGGPGYDYMMASFPLSDFDILPGSEITISATAETNSHVYHHSSIDVILDFGSSKFGKDIIWKLGLNSYTSAMPKF
jgi:hypothetical protein